MKYRFLVLLPLVIVTIYIFYYINSNSRNAKDIKISTLENKEQGLEIEKAPSKDFIEMNFDDAMGESCAQDYALYFQKPEGKSAYKFFKNLYDQNKPSKQTKPSGAIPKVIHQIWPDALDDDLPTKYIWFSEGFKELHPNWEYKLWTNKDILALDFPDKDLYISARSYAEKADIARYAILKKFGGLYVDTDTLCLKSFDKLIENYDFLAGLEPNNSTGYPHLINALIAATPEHPIINRTLEIVRKNWLVIEKEHESNKLSWGSIAGLVQKRTFFPLDIAFKELANLDDHKIIAMPATYFYPKYFTKTCFDSIKINTMSMHDFEKMKTGFIKLDFIKNSFNKPITGQEEIRMITFEELFYKNNPNSAAFKAINRIPDIIHTIDENIQSIWEHYYPSMDYKVWNLEQIQKDQSLKYVHLLSKVHDRRQKALLAKLILAYNFGGVFLEGDILPAKHGENKFSQLIKELNNKYNFYGVLEPRLSVSSKIFAFSKGHIILENIFSLIEIAGNPQVEKLFDEQAYKYMFIGKNIIFPSEYFINNYDVHNEYAVSFKE